MMKEHTCQICGVKFSGRTKEIESLIGESLRDLLSKYLAKDSVTCDDCKTDMLVGAIVEPFRLVDMKKQGLIIS